MPRNHDRGRLGSASGTPWIHFERWLTALIWDMVDGYCLQGHRFPEEPPKQPLSHTLASLPECAIGVAWAAPQEIFLWHHPDPGLGSMPVLKPLKVLKIIAIH